MREDISSIACAEQSSIEQSELEDTTLQQSRRQMLKGI